MKKLFQIIGILSLMGISFFYTEKTVNVVKEYDTIMIELKQNISKYKKDSEDATIINDTIIPGISGVEVDINKSYIKMKKYGSFNESLLVLKKMSPKVSLKNNKDKYIISGNKSNRNVSLIFNINDNDIDELIKILDTKNIKATFIMSDNWFNKNTNMIPIIVREKHIIGLSFKNDINNNREIITKIGKQKNRYCIFDKKNKEIKKLCKNSYLIIPSIIINKNPYENTKQIKNGSILLYSLNKELLEELPIIINYIRSKGYSIVSINDLIEE